MTMTEFDKKLIEKAGRMRRFNYRDVNVLISIADTEQAKDQLSDIRQTLYELAHETI